MPTDDQLFANCVCVWGLTLGLLEFFFIKVFFFFMFLAVLNELDESEPKRRAERCFTMVLLF